MMVLLIGGENDGLVVNARGERVEMVKRSSLPTVLDQRYPVKVELTSMPPPEKEVYGVFRFVVHDPRARNGKTEFLFGFTDPETRDVSAAEIMEALIWGYRR